MSTIPSIEAMDRKNKAALKGLRAVFFGEYGIHGTKLALELSSKAINMNPDESLWYFLKAKYLGRIRRVERPYDVPEPEERELLEKAMEGARKNASYTVFTAQMYRETAKSMFHKYKRNTSTDVNQKSIYSLNEKSLKYYE